MDQKLPNNTQHSLGERGLPHAYNPFPHSPQRSFLQFLTTSPLCLLILVFLLQGVVSRLSRNFLSHLPSSHRYHTHAPEKQRRIHTQLATITAKFPLLYFVLPLLRHYRSALRVTGSYPVWSANHSATLAAYAAMYMFDFTHHHAQLDYFLHHVVSLFWVVIAERYRLRALAAFFTPFFVPGIIFGDTITDVASLVYKLVDRGCAQVWAWAVVLWGLAVVSLFVRVVQWVVVVSYLIRQHEKLREELGSGIWFGILLGAMALWASVEAVDVVVMFTFPVKLVLQAKVEREEALKACGAGGMKPGSAETGCEDAEKSETLVPESREAGDDTGRDAEELSFTGGEKAESIEDVDLVGHGSSQIKTGRSSLMSPRTDSTERTTSKGPWRTLDTTKSERRARLRRKTKPDSSISTATMLDAMGTRVKPEDLDGPVGSSAVKLRSMRRRHASTAPMSMASDSDVSDAESF